MRTQESCDKRPSTITRIIKTPIRAVSKILDLSKIIDLYVKSVTGFSNAYHKPPRTMVELDPNSSHRLPRSFTTGVLPDYDQPPEVPLVRSISAAPAIGGKTANVKLTNFELYMIQRHCPRLQASGEKKVVPRSYCVGMGKIDEDRVSSFRYDDMILKSKRCVDDRDPISSKGCSDFDSLLFLQ